MRSEPALAESTERDAQTPYPSATTAHTSTNNNCVDIWISPVSVTTGDPAVAR
jgi:hypothetical protein